MPMLSNLIREFKPHETSLLIELDRWNFVLEHTRVPHLQPQTSIFLRKPTWHNYHAYTIDIGRKITSLSSQKHYRIGTAAASWL